MSKEVLELEMRRAIGRRIQEFRVSMNLGQKEFGALLGVRHQAVSAWEQGESMPTNDRWVKLGFMGMDLNYTVLGIRTIPVSQYARPMTLLPVRQTSPAAAPSA